tara:strand:- start:6299 stop:7441 length:1143 start_codon:yes stop_codon:yes gene_type:complete
MEIIKKFNKPIYIGTLFLGFLPFIYYGFISSDWDSYASFASGSILITDNTYIPSRPPGFPLYELLLAPLSLFDTRIALITHFFFSVLLFLLVEKSIEKSHKNILLLFLFFTSPIYLIASYTVIDYIVGCFFGFLSISLIKQDKFLLGTFFLIVSSGIRLSNLLFLIACVLYLIIYKKYKESLFVLFSTLIFVLLLYFPSYSIAGGVCFLNLTNTDHDMVGRLGRYFYKQLQIFGLIGSIVFFIALLKSKGWGKLIIKENIPYLLVFISFQISFLRLPTEQGHLLPAFVAFFYLINQLEINKSLIITSLIFSLTSSLVSVEILKPDVPNHATTADVGLFIEKGYLVKNLDERTLKGKNYTKNINQAKINIAEDWKSGGPNC